MEEQRLEVVALRLTDAAIRWIQSHPPTTDSVVDSLKVPGYFFEDHTPAAEELFRAPSEAELDRLIRKLPPSEQERICKASASPEDHWPIRKEVKQDER